jgi:hypothetical protein
VIVHILIAVAAVAVLVLRGIAAQRHFDEYGVYFGRAKDSGRHDDPVAWSAVAFYPQSKAIPILLVTATGFAVMAAAHMATEHLIATNHPLTQAEALKLGPKQLVELFAYGTEATQDNAAQLYATAKRIETEQALAKRNLELVPQLDEWRQALAKCRAGSWELAGWTHGGGTMWYHSGERDCADLEDFLAKLANRLPLAESKGSLKAAKAINQAIAFIKKIQPYNDSKDFPAVVRKIAKEWEKLKVMIQDIPAADAQKIAAFAIDSLDCLKEGDRY